MKGMETNGLFVLGAGAIELVVVDVPKADSAWAWSGFRRRTRLIAPPLRSQSSSISYTTPMTKLASTDAGHAKGSAPPPLPWLSQRLDPRAGEGQGPGLISHRDESPASRPFPHAQTSSAPGSFGHAGGKVPA
jgi:hypothetical protein